MTVLRSVLTAANAAALFMAVATSAYTQGPALPGMLQAGVEGTAGVKVAAGIGEVELKHAQ